MRRPGRKVSSKKNRRQILKAFIQKSRRAALACRLAVLPVAFCAVALPLQASAQNPSFPEHPVKIVVPSAPGGSLDITAREVASKLAGIWKQPVIVENRADARFIIGASYVARSAPDGYTMLFSNISVPAINPAIFHSLPYEASDFVAVAQASAVPVGLFVNSELPVNSVKELLAMMRAQPGKMNHGSGGTSTLMHSELLKALANVDYLDINYKGASGAMLSVASGETQFAFADMASAGPQLKAGRIRQLAVTSEKRSVLLPDVPTINESGVPGYKTVSWGGLFAPAKTPRDIVLKINADVQRVLAMPDVQAWYKSAGIEAQGGTPEDFARVVQEAQETWGNLARSRHINLD
jgi:tripartite-type tricarboxylate transporter receptor subunit TctC